METKIAALWRHKNLSQQSQTSSMDRVLYLLFMETVPKLHFYPTELNKIKNLSSQKFLSIIVN